MGQPVHGLSWVRTAIALKTKEGVAITGIVITGLGLCLCNDWQGYEFQSSRYSVGHLNRYLLLYVANTWMYGICLFTTSCSRDLVTLHGTMIAGLGHPMELDSGNYLSMALTPIFIVTFIVIATISILIRIIYVISRSSKPLKRVAHEPLSTLIVLGSGGHTAEMLNLLSELQKDKFVPRIYIAASTDNMSLQKAQALETSLVDQILCNGPGTCIPLCIIAFFFKVVGIRWSSIFYVESIARVRKLSLSGLLLYKLQMADQFFVQWPQLEKKYPQAHYVGCLM
ncbi:hypothetical protein IFM89_033247 [Coptis chinensis]|uniref:UDP-N-acetylglucosamine transferase subunit ALG14 n=1 Tax=Coptis chinensis TaxID=261450 RepID=A0A835J3G9_9MAGN|nr:hypothetical protein IFM89_033247 [Coptis chinensis]